MTSFENPKAIRHFQSICDSCQDLVTRFHTPSDLKLYSDGFHERDKINASMRVFQ